MNALLRVTVGQRPFARAVSLEATVPSSTAEQPFCATLPKENAVRVLPVIGIGGMAASGKTSFAQAIGAPEPVPGMDDSVRWSEIEIIADGVLYKHGCVFSETKVQQEWAFWYPHGRRALLFERSYGTIQFGKSAQISKSSFLRSGMHPDRLFLKQLMRFHENVVGNLAPLLNYCRGLSIIDGNEPPEFAASLDGKIPKKWSEIGSPWAESGIPVLDHHRDVGGSEHALFRAALRLINPHLVNLRSEDPDSLGSSLMAVYEFADGTTRTVPLLRCSRRTQQSIAILGSLIHHLVNGGLCIVDDLDCALAPPLLRWVVKQFSDPQINTNSGQLLFTALDPDEVIDGSEPALLAPEQIYRLEQRNDGRSIMLCDAVRPHLETASAAH